MTLAEFKSDPKRMRAAADLRLHATYVSVVAVLDSELRRSMEVSPLHLPQDDKSYRLGEITGFNRCLQLLLTIANPPEPPSKQIESTFGVQPVKKAKP